jgi:hypothetical protein
MNTPEFSTVVGVFYSSLEADQAIAQLQQAGFSKNEIGVAMRHAETAEDEPSDDDKMDTTSGALAGALAGTGLGALTGVGILTGMIPVVGPAIAAGTLGVILSNAIAGAGAVGLIGALVGAGLPKHEAEYYQGQLEAGRVIVTVNAGNRSDEATDILLDNGGYFMSSDDAFTVSRAGSTV